MADLSPSPRSGDGGLARMATMDVSPSARSPRSYEVEATLPDAPGGGGRLQRPEGRGVGDSGDAGEFGSKRASAGALGGGAYGGGYGMIGAQRGSLGAFPGSPLPEGR